ncbi:MAG: hypothetical protein P1R74_14175, partial [Sedimenticola sp.]|nr:hypothetical protein [Sedimenticola sp.]
MAQLIQQLISHSDLILLLGMLSLLLLMIGIWRRQSRLMDRLLNHKAAIQSDFSSLEQLVRGQERELMGLLLTDRERQRSALNQLQHLVQRQLAQSHQMLERRLGELQRQLLDEGGQL